ncbi:MAG: hypothetical protein U9P14_10715, partial [Gemmatimonadota bacterium]|nr:hypothetical protein [Gemmatimonadota bacterium]
MFESEAAPLFKTVYGLLRAGERTFFKKEDLLNQCGEALDPAGLGSLIEGFVSEDALYFSYKESLDGKRTARFLLDSGHLETISAASYLAAAETALGITIDDGPVMVIDYRDCSRHELAVDDPGSIGRGMDAVASYLERSGNDPAARPAPVRRVLLLSPHGWFAQKDVLGRPDTGGQVVYILDEVRALEREITAALKRSGQEGTPEICILTRLIPEADGTSCDQPLENVEGTDFAYILRVPFRNGQGEVLREWIPRFQVWPHMERFAREAAGTVENVMGGAPDLIIGNYSDGNLAAVVLADIFSAPLAIVAHALEKSKYAHSDVFWQRYQEEYHFAEQFAADLLAMNSAD